MLCGGRDLLPHLSIFAQKWVLERLIRRDAIGRAKGEELVKQIDGLRRSPAEHALQVAPRLVPQTCQVGLHCTKPDNGFCAGRAEHVENDIQLIEPLARLRSRADRRSAPEAPAVAN